MEWVAWPGYPAARVATGLRLGRVGPLHANPFAELDWLRAAEGVLGGFAFSVWPRGGFPVVGGPAGHPCRAELPARRRPAAKALPFCPKCFMQTAWATLTASRQRARGGRPGEAGLSDAQLALVARAVCRRGRWRMGAGTECLRRHLRARLFPPPRARSCRPASLCAWRTCLESIGDPPSHARAPGSGS
jgi:hypothetical protein